MRRNRRRRTNFYNQNNIINKKIKLLIIEKQKTVSVTDLQWFEQIHLQEVFNLKN